MNLVEGGVTNGVFVADEDGWRIPVEGVRDGKHLLGIRPEDVRVPVSESEAVTRLRVEFVELLGPRAIVTLRVGERRMTAVVEGVDLASVREGSTLPVGVRNHGLHLFEPETGVRVTTT